MRIVPFHNRIIGPINHFAAAPSGRHAHRHSDSDHLEDMKLPEAGMIRPVKILIKSISI
jgi:hypothetical protein